jgi:prepilin-type N-terminal cleavage/methylation domain-containing protein
MCQRKFNQQAGFTLIELAMVLVIIGLLLAGALKGTELISQAKMRNIGSSIEGLAVAFQTYQERYRALPGDDPIAQSRWPSSASNGNGDRIICGAYHGGSGGNACSGSTESGLLWQHLRNAGLLAGSGSNAPEHPGNGIFGIQYGGYGITRHILCVSHLLASAAGGIDRQFDDGIANQGDIRSMAQTSSGDVAATTPSSGAYVEEGSTLYVLCKAL